ncbi:hypothetical protein [Candidatus Enterovibrio escicola]|uniref:hypothetical protein n=1 Tax=Candidatus Enterovibrio escicola TaxID=1927127 RepID=UPI003743EE01
MNAQVHARCFGFVLFCSYLTHRQGLPSLIRSSYRFITTYAFLDIDVPRSEEKER